MRWYEGGIAEAVTLSKKNGSVFVVYIEGDDEKSRDLTALINSQVVSEELRSDNFVAIKVEANSLSHQQFSEIYSNTPVPSVYFIGKTGKPIVIITEPKDSSDVLEKIKTVLQQSGLKPVIKEPARATSSFVESEKKDVVCENGVCRLVEKERPANLHEEEPSCSTFVPKREQEQNVTTQTEIPEQTLTTEDKIERAKELIRKTNEAKQLEEQEKERLKEMERRKMGRDVQKMKHQQQDQDMKNAIEEREKEKKENIALRQQILEQIKQDKAERAAKFSNIAPPPIPKSYPQQSSSNSPSNANMSRIQFKLPNGSTHTHEFSKDTKLTEVINYVKENVNVGFSTFTLATMFPRREFTQEDHESSLEELQLFPSAVLLVLPVSHGTVSSNSPYSYTALLWSIIAPVLGIFNYVKSFIFGNNNEASTSQNNQHNKRRAEDVGETSREKRRPGGTTVVRRQHGNVHRLVDTKDSDDENNTWNGNSTQQM